MAGLDRGGRAQPQRAARRQLVGVAAAEGVAHLAASQQPVHVCARLVPGEVGERDQRCQCRVPASRDRDPLARVPGPDVRVGEVRDLVGDPVGRGLLPDRGQPVRAERVRCRPRPGRVDQAACQDPLLAVGGVDVHRQRFGVAACVDDPVAAPTRHPDHPRSVPDAVAQHVGQWL